MSLYPILGIKSEALEERLALAAILHDRVWPPRTLPPELQKKVDMLCAKMMELPRIWRNEIAMEVLSKC